MTPVHATRILRDDHKRLTGLFRQLEAIDLRANEMRFGVSREILMEIEIHSAIETQIFYPALLAALSMAEKMRTNLLLSPAVIDESIRDHHEIDALVQRLHMLSVDHEDFPELLNELIELMDSHVSEEEQITLPAAEQLLADDLSQLGAQMQDLKDDLLSQPQYQDALPRLVQNPHGGEQMRKSS